MDSQNDSPDKQIRRVLDNSGLVRTCLTCEWWDKSKQQCGTYNSVPPPEIIAYACPEWQQEIPF